MRIEHAVDDNRDGSVQQTPAGKTRERVRNALERGDGRMSLNDLATRCESSISEVSRSLALLEEQGRATFAGGFWTPTFRAATLTSCSHGRSPR